MASYLTTSKLMGILQAIDPKGEKLVHAMVDGRLGVGTDPLRPSYAIDFGSERAIALGLEDRPVLEVQLDPQAQRQGAYELEVRGKVIRASSLKEILRHGLLAFETIAPGTLEKLSLIKPRSKRIVARERAELFEKAYLVSDFSEQLNSEWWFGTNNSAQETSAWLERAALCAGMAWGHDCGTNF